MQQTQKRGINPITIRPLPTHPGPSLVMSRMAVALGRPVMKMLSLLLVDERLPQAEQMQQSTFTCLDEDRFIDSLGYLFPGGELLNSSKTGHFPAPAEEPDIGVQLTPGATTVQITTPPGWLPSEPLMTALQAVPGLTVCKIYQRDGVSHNPPLRELEYRATNPAALMILLPGVLAQARAIINKEQ